MVKTLLGDISTPESLDAQARLWVDAPEAWVRRGYGAWGVFDRDDGLLAWLRPMMPCRRSAKARRSSTSSRRRFGAKGSAGARRSALRCDHLFERLNAQALEALIFAELNPGSVRLAEKLGMTLIGRVPIVGHHLTERRARETQDFDLWRLEHTPPDQSQRTLEEAAFRIGQFLGEGIGSRAEMTEALLAAAGGSNRQFIEERLAAGMATPGLAHYRVTRAAYRRRQHKFRDGSAPGP